MKKLSSLLSKLCDLFLYHIMTSCCNSCVIAMRCIYVGRSSSEVCELQLLKFTLHAYTVIAVQSNQYSTISDAVQKLNFQQALRDENCFPFICRVIIIPSILYA